MLIVLTTVANREQADSLANQIIESRLAACVQILPPMTSVYVWEGELEKETEHLLLIKTLPEKWDELQAFISENHSYDVPEIVAIDAAKVAEPYRRWLESVAGTQAPLPATPVPPA